jgi:hypothetical protein
MKPARRRGFLWQETFSRTYNCLSSRRAGELTRYGPSDRTDRRFGQAVVPSFAVCATPPPQSWHLPFIRSSIGPPPCRWRHGVPHSL